MAQDVGTNGTLESLGEVRGEVNAMARQVEALTDAVNHMRLTLANLNTEFQVHMAYHRAAEQQGARDREDRRWQSQRLLAVVGLASGSVAAVVSFALRQIGG